MAKIHKIYRCNHCGNIVQVLHEGAAPIICCGEPMEELKEQTADFKTEKHVPIIEKTQNAVLVKVGSTLHPMEEKHYIEWIELNVDDKYYRQFLKPGDKPEALFDITVRDNQKLIAREYCNIHKLWRN